MKGFSLGLILCVLGFNLNAQIEAKDIPNAEVSSGKLLRVSKFPSKYIPPRD